MHASAVSLHLFSDSRYEAAFWLSGLSTESAGGEPVSEVQPFHFVVSTCGSSSGLWIVPVLGPQLI